MPDWVFQLLTAASGAASVYAAIRADLAALHEKAENAARSADKAHARIDTILTQKRG